MTDATEPPAKADPGVISMYASEAATWESACDELLRLSGEEFAAGHDDRARYVRSLSEKWRPRVKAARDRQAAYEAEHGIVRAFRRTG